MRELSRMSLHWELLIEFSLQHKVYPLIYWNLNTYVKDAVPANILAKFQYRFGMNAMLNQRMKNEYLRITRKFQAAGIDDFLVRGPILALQLYDDLFLRDFKDIDILVPAKDYQAASDILNSFGYYRKETIDDNSFNYTFTHLEQNIEVELHWALDSPFVPVHLGPNYYWDHALPYKLDDVVVKTFQPDDLLLLLCFHGVKHRWHRLKWLCDIDQFLLRYQDLDWNALLRKANELHIRRVLLQSLYLSNVIFTSPLPAPIAAAIEAEPVVKSLAYYVEGWMITHDEKSLIDQARGILFYLLIRERMRDRLFSIRHALQYPRSPITRTILKSFPLGRLGGEPTPPSPNA
jgi:hypothetical protein